MVHKLLHYKHEIILLVVSVLLLFAGLDKVEVNIMEARNFVSAREMVQNNEYLLTTLNGEPRYQKPPLPTWLTAVSGSIFGFDSLYGLRLPVTIITLLLVFVFYKCSRLMGLTHKQSLNNSLILITSFYIFFAGRDNQWDMYTHSFMLVSIYFLWKVLKKESGGFTDSLVSGIFLGLSILSKGPVSLYVLFIPFLMSYIAVYHISLRRSGVYLLTMILTGVIVGSSWYLFVRFKDPEYFSMVAAQEITNWGSYETKPFYYYWNFFIQSGLWTIPSLTSLFYPFFKSRVRNLKAYRFAILWTLLSVVLLSIIPEKKVRYILPCLIPLAITTGFYIEYLIVGFKIYISTKERAWARFSFGILPLAGLSYPVIIPLLLKEAVMGHMLLYVISSIVSYVCSFIIIKGLYIRDFGRVFYSSAVLFAIIMVVTYPLSAGLNINPEYHPASKAREFEKHYSIKSYRLSDIAPEIVWDFGCTIPLFPEKQNRKIIPVEDTFGLFIDADSISVLKNRFPDYKIDYVCKIDMNYRNNKKSRLIKEYYILSVN